MDVKMVKSAYLSIAGKINRLAQIFKSEYRPDLKIQQGQFSLKKKEKKKAKEK